MSLDAKLQPALEVSSTALRRADDIFQNEQEMILQAAQASVKPKKPQLYIDENGYVLGNGLPPRILNAPDTVGFSPRVGRLVQIPSSITLLRKRHH